MPSKYCPSCLKMESIWSEVCPLFSFEKQFMVTNGSQNSLNLHMLIIFFYEVFWVFLCMCGCILIVAWPGECVCIRKIAINVLMCVAVGKQLYLCTYMCKTSLSKFDI